MQFQNTNRFNTAASFAAYMCDSFDWLIQREGHIPRMMTIGLLMITRPGRMPALESILEHITKSDKAWILCYAGRDCKTLVKKTFGRSFKFPLENSTIHAKVARYESQRTLCSPNFSVQTPNYQPKNVRRIERNYL